MSLQEKCNVRHSPSNQPSIVWSTHNLAMQCANPHCSKELLYLREGRLELLELESRADDPFSPEDGAFAMRSLPSKLFWLCGECAKAHMVKRWTTSGLVVVLRNQNTADSHPDLKVSRTGEVTTIGNTARLQRLDPKAGTKSGPKARQTR